MPDEVGRHRHDEHELDHPNDLAAAGTVPIRDRRIELRICDRPEMHPRVFIVQWEIQQNMQKRCSTQCNRPSGPEIDRQPQRDPLQHE